MFMAETDCLEAIAWTFNLSKEEYKDFLEKYKSQPYLMVWESKQIAIR